jgi:deoxyribodipyrimidine photo-lyase
MLDCLADLDRSLAKCGARVVVRCSAVVEETMRLVRQIKAVAIFASADVSAHARRREARLAGACREVGLEFRTFPGICVVDPGTLRPSSGSDHFRVFTPYWRRWRRMPLRPIAPTPARLDMPPGIALGRPPGLRELTHGAPSPELPAGGETVGRTRLAAWIRSGLRRYGVDRDDLGADAASHLSAYVHFGCRRRGRSSRV